MGDVLKEFFEYNQIEYLVSGGFFLLLYIIGGILLYRYIKSGYKGIKQTAVKNAVIIYFSVLLFSLTVSLFRPIYYVRYTVVLCGLLFFSAAVLIVSFRKKPLRIIAAAVLLLLFVIQTVHYYDLLYDSSADSVKETLGSKVDLGDIFLFDNANE